MKLHQVWMQVELKFISFLNKRFFLKQIIFLIVEHQNLKLLTPKVFLP